jgi:hypothetical protein
MERLNHRLSFFFSPSICFLLSCAKVALFILKKGYCFFGSCEWDEISAPPSFSCLCYLYIFIVNQWKIRKKMDGFSVVFLEDSIDWNIVFELVLHRLVFWLKTIEGNHHYPPWMNMLGSSDGNNCDTSLVKSTRHFSFVHCMLSSIYIAH